MISPPQPERMYSLAEMRQALLLKDQYTIMLHRAQDFRVQLNEETYGSWALALTSVSLTQIREFQIYCAELNSFAPCFKDEYHRLEAIVQDIEKLCFPEAVASSLSLVKA